MPVSDESGQYPQFGVCVRRAISEFTVALQPRHEAEIGVRFAGSDQLAHLIGKGEVMPRLGRGLGECLHGPVQTGDNFSDGNHAVSSTHH